MTIFYTSDTHFSHANIIKYSNRPFKSVEEMNFNLIHRWNLVVSPTDTVYHLGDFGFTTLDKNNEIASKLNGNKYILLGNHDRHAPKGFTKLNQCYELKDNGQLVILCHYGMRVWNKSHHGSIHLYGHSHGSLPGDSLSLDVGVDCWDYYPISLETIKERLKTLPSREILDHHGKNG